MPERYIGFIVGVILGVVLITMDVLLHRAHAQVFSILLANDVAIVLAVIAVNLIPGKKE